MQLHIPLMNLNVLEALVGNTLRLPLSLSLFPQFMFPTPPYVSALTLQSSTRTMASAASPAEVHTTCESTRLVFTRWSPTCSRLLWIVLREHSTIPEGNRERAAAELAAALTRGGMPQQYNSILLAD